MRTFLSRLRFRAAALFAFATLLSTSSRAAEFLGEPCRAANVLASGIVHARDKEYFALANMNEISHAELILIDVKTGEGKLFKAPAGAGCWAMQQVDPHRVVLGTYYDGMFMVFDLDTMKFTKTIHFPGEEYLWEFAIGSDGRLYTGTYPGGKLGALDLTTYEVKDFGNPAQPNMYCRNVSPMPDGRIYAHFGLEKNEYFIFDPKARQFTPAPREMEKFATGVVWNNYFLGIAETDGSSPIAFDKDLKPVNPPPFPLPAGNVKWTVNGNLTDQYDLYITQGKTLYHTRPNDATLHQELEADLHGGSITARATDGTYLGLCGQRWFTISPNETEIHLHPFPVELSPREILFLEVDPHGIVWGGPTFGETLCYIDPETKKFTNTDRVCNGGGEVYDVAFLNDKVYAVAYSGGDIIEYDPRQPWDQFNNKNPRTITHLATRGYIRPEAGIKVGDDHLLYSAWWAKYGTYGGAVAITDPQTGKTDLVENPLGEEDLASIAVDDRYIYIGTTCDGNGLPPKRGASASFGVIDKATRKVVYSHTFPGRNAIRKIARDRKTGLVALSADGWIEIFDPSKIGTASAGPALPQNLPGRTDGPLLCPGDGTLCVTNGNTVLSFELNGAKIKSAKAPAHIQNLAISADGTIYASSSSKLYKLKWQ